MDLLWFTKVWYGAIDVETCHFLRGWNLFLRVGNSAEITGDAAWCHRVACEGFWNLPKSVSCDLQHSQWIWCCWSGLQKAKTAGPEKCIHAVKVGSCMPEVRYQDVRIWSIVQNGWPQKSVILLTTNLYFHGYFPASHVWLPEGTSTEEKSREIASFYIKKTYGL